MRSMCRTICPADVLTVENVHVNSVCQHRGGYQRWAPRRSENRGALENSKNVDRQPSSTTFSPIRWARWRMLRVWSP